VVTSQHERVVYKGLHDRKVAGAYFAGLELVDKAMLVAQENRGIVFDSDKPFEFLGRFHVTINLYRAISQQDNNLDWLFRGSIRLDVLRFHNLVPYVQAGGDVLGQEQWNFVPKVETGVRMHWKNFEFTPFVQWGHTEEWLRIYQNVADGPYVPKTIHFESRSYLYAGGRLEFLLDRESIATRNTGAPWQVFPEVHGQGDYGLYLGSQYNSSDGGFNLNLDLVRWQQLSLFANLGMHAESTPETFGPENVLYSVDYGFRYDWPQVFLEGFARNAARVHVTGGYGAESPNQAGMRVGTQGIRLGHYEDGISFEGPGRFHWVNKFNAQVGLGHFFNTARWPANWNLATEGRWDIFRLRRKIVYVQGGLDWLTATKGSTDVVNYCAEPGLRFHGVMDLAVFYRFQHKENVIIFRGPTENQSLLGIRVIF
jgi:hypothetical protein